MRSETNQYFPFTSELLNASGNVLNRHGNSVTLKLVPLFSLTTKFQLELKHNPRRFKVFGAIDEFIG